MGFVSDFSKRSKVNLSCLRSGRNGNKFGDKYAYPYKGNVSLHKEISHAAKSRVEVKQDKIFKRDLILILSIFAVCIGLLGLIL